MTNLGCRVWRKSGRGNDEVMCSFSSVVSWLYCQWMRSTEERLAKSSVWKLVIPLALSLIRVIEAGSASSI